MCMCVSVRVPLAHSCLHSMLLKTHTHQTSHSHASDGGTHAAAMSRCVRTEHIHACTRTAQLDEPGDGRIFSAVAMVTQPPSDGEKKRDDFLEGHEQTNTHHIVLRALFCSSSLRLISSSQALAAVSFVLFPSVCVYLSPPCLFMNPIVSPLESLICL